MTYFELHDEARALLRHLWGRASTEQIIRLRVKAMRRQRRRWALVSRHGGNKVMA